MPTLSQRGYRPQASRPVRIGFVGLLDCAPLILAEEARLFDRFGVRVQLSRELGWASVRDKLAFGELDAAHAPCTFPFLLRLGASGAPSASVAPLVLGCGGNAITLSRGLHRAGVTDGASLKHHLREQRHPTPLVFGVVSLTSTHRHLLDLWLRRGELSADADVRLVVVPPAQLPGNLAAGHLDGFCAGEPWNAVAVAAGTGWCAATSADLAPGHPEKVLAVHPEFAARREPDLLRVVAALLLACRRCADPAGEEEAIELLSRPRYLGLSPSILRAGCAGRPPAGGCAVPAAASGAVTPGGDRDHAPDTARAAWVVRHLLPQADRPRFPPAMLSQVYRLDLFETARCLLDPQARHETKLETCSLAD